MGWQLLVREELLIDPRRNNAERLGNITIISYKLLHPLFCITCASATKKLSFS